MAPVRRKRSDPFLQAFHAEAARRRMSVVRVQGENATLRLGKTKRIVSLAEPRRAFEGVFPDDRFAVLSEYLASFAELFTAETTESFEEARERILPRISTKIDSENPLPSIPLVAGALDVYFVIDEPRRMRYITREDLSNWGKHLSQMLPVGIANLRTRTNWGALRQLGGLRHAFLYPKVDAFVAARMLLLRDALLAWPWAGVVVAAPDRSVLAFVPLPHLDTVGSLDIMARSAREAAGSRPFPLVPELLWFDGRDWEPVPVVDDAEGLHAEPSDRFIEALAVS